MRYTNFGSWIARNEFSNLMREVETDASFTANALVSTQLSIHATPAPPPPGATAALPAAKAHDLRGEARLLEGSAGAEVLA